MTDPLNARADVVLTRLARFNATVQGLVCGIMLGGAVFVATNWLILKGGEVVGPHLALLGQFFIGYRVSFVGSLIGFGYGSVIGFIGGYLLATLYNWFGSRREAQRWAGDSANRREESLGRRGRDQLSAEDAGNGTSPRSLIHC